MEELKIDATDHTPEIYFNRQEGVMLIQGQSLPENAKDFYDPIVDWADALFDEIPQKMDCTLNLSYLNSSSSKQILRVLFAMEDLAAEGCAVKVVWKYPENDELMHEKGNEFAQMLEIPVEVQTA